MLNRNVDFFFLLLCLCFGSRAPQCRIEGDSNVCRGRFIALALIFWFICNQPSRMPSIGPHLQPGVVIQWRARPAQHEKMCEHFQPKMIHAATAAAMNGACNHPISQIQQRERQSGLYSSFTGRRGKKTFFQKDIILMLNTHSDPVGSDLNWIDIEKYMKSSQSLEFNRSSFETLKRLMQLPDWGCNFQRLISLP